MHITVAALRQYFEAEQLILGIVRQKEPPFVIPNERKGSTDILPQSTATHRMGAAVDIVHLLVEAFHFNYTLYWADGWGLNSNGLTDLLARRAINVTVGQMSVTYERQQVMNYTMPLWRNPQHCFFSCFADSEIEMKPESILDIWSWLCIVLCLTTGCVAIVLRNWYFRPQLSMRTVKPWKALQTSVLFGFLWVLVQGLLQSGFFEMFTEDITGDAFQNEEQLARRIRNENFTLCFNKEHSAPHYSVLNSETLQELPKVMRERESQIHFITDAVERAKLAARNPSVVSYLMPRDIAFHLRRDETQKYFKQTQLACNCRYMGSKHEGYWISMGVQRDQWKLQEYLSRALSHLHSFGFPVYFSRKYHMNEPYNLPKMKIDPQSVLVLNSFKLIFLRLVGGYAIAVAGLLLEVMWARQIV